MKKVSGKTRERQGAVAGTLKEQLLARLETFVRSEVYLLELAAVDAAPEQVVEARDVFKALLHLADEMGLLGDNGKFDTWVQFMRRYYRVMDRAEAAVKGKLDVEVAEPDQARLLPKAARCACGSVLRGSLKAEGECTCGVHKPHRHCRNCGGVVQGGG